MKKDKEGNTPFHLVAASGDVDTLENFIFYYELETGTGDLEAPGENKGIWFPPERTHFPIKCMYPF